jgi:hypothetical protein
MDREIPERHAALLRQIANVPGPEPLPEKLVDGYWEWKRCASRISHGPSESDLVWMCVHAGYGKRKEAPKVETIADLVKAKKVKAGAPLLVTVGGKELEAKLKRIMPSGEVSVETTNGNQYKLPAKDVRVAELVGV